MSAQSNPYAPPTARVDDVGVVDPEADAIRNEYIKHEASVRSIGSLYLISAVFGAIGGLVVLVATASASQDAAALAVMGVVYIALSAFLFFVGRGVRRLERWARTAAIIFACIGLLGFPLGTLINAYILYLMLSAKGKRIFEPDYAEIVAATPHIKYRTSLLVWILLAIVLLGICAAIVIPLVGR